MLEQWRKRLLGVSVRIKIMGIGLGMLTLLGLGMVGYIRVVLHDVLENELKARGLSLAQNVAVRVADVIPNGEPSQIQAFAREPMSHFADIRYVLVLDPKQEPLAQVIGSWWSPQQLTSHALPSNQSQDVQQVATRRGKLWDIAVGIRGGEFGTVRVGIDNSQIQKRLHQTTTILLIVTLGTASVGMVAAYVLTTMMTQPIRELEEVARRAGTRDFSGRAQAHFDDELGRLTATFSDMIEKLAESQTEIESYNQELVKRDISRKQLLHQVMAAQEKERYRIARELHDETSQLLAALSVALGALDTTVRRGGIVNEEQIQNLQQMAKDVLNEVRRVVQNLRPAMLDDLGLTAAIRWWIHQCSFQGKTQFCMQLIDESLLMALQYPLLDRQEAQVHMFRIVQEAITNVMKHASAERAWVSVKLEGKILYLSVSDDGIGFDSKNVLNAEQTAGHFGLRGIAERVELLGGTLKLESGEGKGKGTRLTVSVPVTIDTETLEMEG